MSPFKVIVMKLKFEKVKLNALLTSNIINPIYIGRDFSQTPLALHGRQKTYLEYGAFFEKIVNDFYSLTFFPPKKLHRRCPTRL